MAENLICALFATWVLFISSIYMRYLQRVGIFCILLPEKIPGKAYFRSVPDNSSFFVPRVGEYKQSFFVEERFWRLFMGMGIMGVIP